MSAPEPARCATVAAGPMLAIILALVLPLGLRGDVAPAAGVLAATRTLVARLSAAGRGEAAFTVTLTDPMGGPDRVQRGRLALEPPDRVRLDFPATGERIALRGDGGEWIQPQARQMVRLAPEQAGMASWLWEVLLKGGAAGFSERATGPRRFALTPRDRDAGLPEGITVVLDPRGLPTQIEFAQEGGAGARYRFQSWRFARQRGAGGFTLTAPRGHAIVDLP